MLETEDEKKERQKRNLLSQKKNLSLETKIDKKERQEKNLRSKNNKKNSIRLETLGDGIVSFENFDENQVPTNYLGLMNVQCKFCGSLNFMCGKPSDGKFSNCCHKGKI